MTSELTRILAEAEQRERLAADELLEVLYDELCAVAQARLQTVADARQTSGGRLTRTTTFMQRWGPLCTRAASNA